jgi:hypothetical protein
VDELVDVGVVVETFDIRIIDVVELLVVQFENVVVELILVVVLLVPEILNYSLNRSQK